MPYSEPPDHPPGDPVLRTLDAGVILHRVHDGGFDAAAFNPTAADNPFRGGRFDSSDGSYTYLYAGDDVATALAEAFLREVPADEIATRRRLPSVALVGRVMSRLRVEKPISLVSLSGADAYAVGQDGWLTTADAKHYPHTRAWAAAIREWAPDAGGFVWRSRVDNNRYAYVFFGDRVAADGLRKEGPSRKCTSRSGIAMVRSELAKYFVTIGAP